jgi:hypothetical protein
MSIVQTFFLHFREVTMGLADPMASIPPAAPVPRSLSLEPPGGGGRTTPAPATGRLAQPTPVPRTRASAAATSIDTTLPAGTRREDILADDDEPPRDTPLAEAPASIGEPEVASAAQRRASRAPGEVVGPRDGDPEA